jgi:predicted nucleic acid-binding protein
MVKMFTLDTNCLIDIAENRPAAAAVRALAAAHAEGRADVAIVAISASEAQLGGRFIQNYDEFRNRLV